MVKFMIRLTPNDFRALRQISDQEYRDPRQQASQLIREALERRGYRENSQNPADTRIPKILEKAS